MRTVTAPAETLRPARIPWLSLTVAGVVTVVSALAAASPTVMATLVRDTGQFHDGQWWRLVTPVFVQPSGWGQWAFNTAGIVLVGAAVERGRSRPSWLAVFLVAGVGSVAILTAWRPAEGGGGSSDAVAGLIGALVVLTWSQPTATPTLRDRVAFAYAAFFASYLALLGPVGLWPAIVVGDLAVVAVLAARLPWRTVSQAVALLVAVAGVVMAAAADGHGLGILLGAAVAAAWRGGRISRSEPAAGSSLRPRR